MARNKIVYGNEVLIDLTQDNITASDVINGKTFHLPSGETTTGTCTYDADTSDATALESEILETKTAYKNGVKLTGTMTNRGGVTGTISSKTDEYIIQSGFHDGSGKVSIADSEQAKIIAGNIKSGVNILGVTGTYSGEGGQGQSKNVTPYTTAQTILPDTGYDYLTQVNVSAIYYNEIDNTAGGKTVTIGTVAPTT